MRQEKRNILVTRPLSGPQIQYARILGLEPIVKPALRFEFPSYWDKVLKGVTDHPRADWVFTSQNGVKALEQLMKSGLQVRPETQIFAVGTHTRKALQELGLDAQVPVTQDGKHLGKLIIREGKSKSIIYFHGNLSRQEISHQLRQKDIEVIELEVYKTYINPVSFPDEPPISGILFYSPSAVKGFAEGQEFQNDLPPAFAIGPTTAASLKEAGATQVVVANKPDTELLLRTTADYIFNNNP